MANDAEQNKIKNVSSYTTSDYVIEEIHDELRVPETQFLLYEKSTGEISYKEHIELEDGKILVPQMSPLIDFDVIRLPEFPTAFGSVTELVNDIRAMLYKYIDINSFYLNLVPYYVLMTWVYDRLTVVPYLRALGDLGSGKTRFVQVVGSLCYNPIFIAGAATTSPIFRLLEQFSGTLVFNEMDLSDSRGDMYADIVKIFNCGFEKGLYVLRTEGDGKKEVRAYKTFGPKIFAMRSKFPDAALESRIFSVPMQQTSRTDIPRLLPTSFQDEIKEIRNKLFMYRLQNVDAVQLDELPRIEGVEPRLEQTLTPLASVIPTEEERQELYAYARQYQEQLTTDRGLEVPVIVARKLIELFEQQDHVAIKDLANKVSEEMPEYKAFTPAKIGRIVRGDLQFKTKQAGGKYYIVFNQKQVDYLKRRYGFEGLQGHQTLQPERGQSGDSGDFGDPEHVSIESLPRHLQKFADEEEIEKYQKEMGL